MNKFELSPVTKEFRRQVKTHLPESEIRVIAGISGGPDSMAMLYLLHRMGIETIVVHCNYQLRAAASDEDQKLIEQIAMHWKLECISLRVDSTEESSGNFQNWARKRRYQAFEDIKREYAADYILTAHHQDDQLETIIQKILRGSGMGSWQAMSVMDDDLFRPLLQLSKSDIMRFVQQFNVPYRIDRTNEESTYARNFIRNHWFPDLNRLFPGWKKNILRLTDRAKEFELMTDRILQTVSDTKTILNRERLLDLHSKLRASVLLRYFKLNGVNEEISQGFLNNLNEIEQIQTGKKLQFSKNRYLYRDRNQFIITEGSDFTEVYHQIKKDQLEDGTVYSGIKFFIQQLPDRFNTKMLHLDIEKVEFPCILRNWRDGDRFQPLGMDGSQLVSDHLTNRKIPSTEKKSAMVLETFDSKICAVIFPNYSESSEMGTISEYTRCTSTSERILTISQIE